MAEEIRRGLCEMPFGSQEYTGAASAALGVQVKSRSMTHYSDNESEQTGGERTLPVPSSCCCAMQLSLGLHEMMLKRQKSVAYRTEEERYDGINLFAQC
jgi:hypothetical protein